MADNEKKIQTSVTSHVLPVLFLPALLPPCSPEKLHYSSDPVSHISRNSPLGIIFRNVVHYLDCFLKRICPRRLGLVFLLVKPAECHSEPNLMN